MKTREMIEDYLNSLGCGISYHLVTEYIIKGMTVSEIAKKHSMSTPTVRTYIRKSLLPIAHEMNVVSPLLGNCTQCSKTYHSTEMPYGCTSP